MQVIMFEICQIRVPSEIKGMSGRGSKDSFLISLDK